LNEVFTVSCWSVAFVISKPDPLSGSQPPKVTAVVFTESDPENSVRPLTWSVTFTTALPSSAVIQAIGLSRILIDIATESDRGNTFEVRCQTGPAKILDI